MIEADVYEALQALAGGQVFWGVAPQGTVAPWIVLTRVSGQRDWTLAGPSGARRLALQVDCYADTPMAAINLAEAAFEALTAPGVPFGLGPARDLPSEYDDDMALHRASMEYQIQT